jgi:hypothetical protein
MKKTKTKKKPTTMTMRTTTPEDLGPYSSDPSSDRNRLVVLILASLLAPVSLLGKSPGEA